MYRLIYLIDTFNKKKKIFYIVEITLTNLLS